MNLEFLEDKKMLILGFAREGVDTFKFLRKVFPNKILGIADQKKIQKLDKKAQKLIQNEKCSRSIEEYLGKNYLRALKNYDIIIKTPGIAPKMIEPFVTKSQKITSQTEIFFENCPGKIVGITGTKGKSTTCSLIYKILKENGIHAHLVGNIGKPALSFLNLATENEVYIYELSSHQLFGLKHSPHIAVLLNIYPEHGDYYQNFKEYIEAKSNIARWQTEKDYLIFNSENKIVKKIAKQSKARKIPLNSVNVKSLIRLSDIPLEGKFNLQNIKAAIAVGSIFGISRQRIKKAIENFKGLPHRLELVGEFKKIKFYNDSLGTIPEATIEAIDALSKNLETIILGGFDRGQDFKNLAKKILESNIKTLILFPDTGKRIRREIDRHQSCRLSLRYFFVDDMREAVKLAFQYTKRGKICLLSPASASFNLFKDYKERGNLFKKFVKQLAKR